MEIQEKINMGIELYVSSKQSMKKVSEQVGISLTCLQKHLSNKGLSRSNKENSRKYSVNHEYFSNITTSEKAYWLGFLYADGYITSGKQKCIGIALSIKDKSQLQKLKTSLNSNYPIKDYETVSYGKKIKYSRLLITSDSMHKDLKEKGVSLNKSLVLKFPNEGIIPCNLMHHFVRGYFDGDGSLSKATNGFTFKVCGTEEFLTSLKNWLGFPEHKFYKRNKDQKNTYSLEIGGNLQVLECCNKIYQDASIKMDRKFKRYQTLLEKYTL